MVPHNAVGFSLISGKKKKVKFLNFKKMYQEIYINNLRTYYQEEIYLWTTYL